MLAEIDRLLIVGAIAWDASFAAAADPSAGRF
jgi:hypothetical protein